MKYILSLLLSLFITTSLFAFDLVPLSYYGLSYGMTPKEVNDSLIASNFITAAATVENGTFYRHYNSDPELVYYHTIKNEWYNMAFTTTPIEELYTRDASISFPVSTTNGQFKRMVVKMPAKETENSTLNIFWTYRFYFDNDRLFAISVRYEDISRLEEYRQLNNGNTKVHPGYQTDINIFNGTMLELGRKYGGFNKVFRKQFNKIYGMHYNAYIDSIRKAEVTVYYGKIFNDALNFTISYFDSYLFKDLVDDLQKEVHHRNNYPNDILPLDL